MRYVLMLAFLLLFSQQVFAADYIVKIPKADIFTFSANNNISKTNNNNYCFENECYMSVDENELEALLLEGLVESYEKSVEWELFEEETEYISKEAYLAMVDIDSRYFDQWFMVDWFRIKATIAGSVSGASKPISAVIDTGVAHHSNITMNDILAFPCYNTQSTGMSEGFCVDIDGHGTHVSGIIANGDSNGNEGTSFGLGQIYSINAAVMGSRGKMVFNTSDILEALEKVYNAKKNGYNIIAVNMSLGGDSYSEAVFNAILKLKSVDVIVVAAAGNNGQNLATYPTFPASYVADNIVSVGALKYDENSSNNKMSRASYSNFGLGVSIYAPGDNILSTVPNYHGRDIKSYSPSLGRIILNGMNPKDLHSLVFNAPYNTSWEINNNTFELTTKGANQYHSITSFYTYNLTAYEDFINSKYRIVGVEFTGTGSCKVELLIDNGSYPRIVDSKQCNGKTNLLLYNVPNNETNLRFSINVADTNVGDNVKVSKIFIAGSDIADGYALKSGTSMAAPYVTGALVAAKALYPNAKAPQLLNMLLNNHELHVLSNDINMFDISSFIDLAYTCSSDACNIPNSYPKKEGYIQYTPTYQSKSSGGCVMSDSNDNLLIIIPFLLITRLFFLKRKRV